MLRAAREGWIEPTDRYAKSDRTLSHGRRKLVWRSLIYGEQREPHQLELDIVKGVFG